MSEKSSKQSDLENLQYYPSGVGKVVDDPETAHDAVFGDIGENGPNYRNVRVLDLFLEKKHRNDPWLIRTRSVGLVPLPS